MIYLTIKKYFTTPAFSCKTFPGVLFFLLLSFGTVFWFSALKTVDPVHHALQFYDKYIYVLEYQILSGSKKDIRNNLVVYDFFTGQFVQRIPLDVGVETENIIIWNDCIYVFCNNSTWTGAECYQINLVPDFGN